MVYAHVNYCTMPTTENNNSNRVDVTVADHVYEINGPKLKEALQRAGVSQAQLAELCGFTGSAYICRICSDPRARVHGEAMSRITAALKQINVEVTGIVPRN